MDIELNVKLLDVKCYPFKGYEKDAGIDLKAKIPKLISVGQFTTETIPTGVCVEIPPGHVGIVAPRSSMNKRGISIEIGIVDEGYTGEISVCLSNKTSTPFHVEPYDRIAQLVILPVACVTKLNFVDKLEDRERGDSGFGSTGVK